MEHRATLEEIEQLARACADAGEGWLWGDMKFDSVDAAKAELSGIFDRTVEGGSPDPLQVFFVHVIDPDGRSCIAACTGNGPTSREHARFFSVAPRLVLELAAEVRRLEAELDR